MDCCSSTKWSVVCRGLPGSMGGLVVYARPTLRDEQSRVWQMPGPIPGSIPGPMSGADTANVSFPRKRRQTNSHNQVWKCPRPVFLRQHSGRGPGDSRAMPVRQTPCPVSIRARLTHRKQFVITPVQLPQAYTQDGGFRCKSGCQRYQPNHCPVLCSKQQSGGTHQYYRRDAGD